MSHKAKLFFYKNIYNILFFINTILLIATFIVIFVGLGKIDKQTQKNEDTSKALYCILLISPDNRNSNNVTDCIKRNTGQNTIESDRLFQTINTDQPKRLLDNNAILELFKGPKGDSGKNGESIIGPVGPEGSQGVQGESGIQGASGTPGEKGEKGDVGPAGKEVEFRHNSSKNRIEWRYVGDSLWQILAKDCQLTNTCP